MGLPFTNSYLVVPHPVLYSAPGLLPLVWPLALHTRRARAASGAPPSRVRCSPKGPKLGFEYLPTYKTLHYVRTACTAFPQSESEGRGLEGRGTIQRGGGGILHRQNFCTRKFCTRVISHSGLKIEQEISDASRIFYPRRFLHDLDLNPRAQAPLPFGCCAARVLKFQKKKFRPSVCKWSLSWHMSVTGLILWMCSGLSAEKSWIQFLATLTHQPHEANVFYAQTKPQEDECT